MYTECISAFVAPSEKILPIPSTNKFYCLQDREYNGYRILDHNKKLSYYVIAKTVATRSHYRISRSPDGVALATLDQDQLNYKFSITDEHDNLLATIELVSSDTIKLQVAKDTYTSPVHIRGKQFEFTNTKNQIVLTIDKKLISLKDQYVVTFVENFPALIAPLVAVVIDDVYHLGPTN